MEPHLKCIPVLGQGTECHCIIAWESLPSLKQLTNLAISSSTSFFLFSLEAIVSEANDPAGSSHPIAYILFPPSFEG